jgi:hypothetical protein
VLIDAVEAYLDFLAPDDLVTLIPFSNVSSVLLSARSVANLRAERVSVRSVLDGWTPRFADTHMNRGLVLARDAVQAARERGFSGVERINCLTDGELDDYVDCQLTFREFRHLKLETNLLGFGLGFSSQRAEKLLAPGQPAFVRYVPPGMCFSSSYGHGRTATRVGRHG